MRTLYLAAFLLLAAGLGLVVPAQGAGPLVATTSGTPVPYAWSTASEVIYNCDQGFLGNLDNATAVGHVDALFQRWEDLPHCKIGFSRGADLGTDIDTLAEYNALLNANDGINQIVFDQSGAIFQAMGAGQENFILGFAGFQFFGGAPAGVIEGGYALLNGRFVDGVTDATNPEYSIENYRAVFLHEFGHFMNLDHSQVNRVEAADADAANDTAVVTMHPLLINTSDAQQTPHVDDQASAGAIYPEATFATSFGTIEGRVFLPDGVTPFQGMNVVARKVDDPKVTASSCVSGFLYRSTDNNSGVLDASYQGYYRISGLPPGSYTVEMEAVDNRWAGGSSVGPVDPVPLNSSSFEYWNGFNESADPVTDDAEQRVIIPVAAGQTVSSINFTQNFSTGLFQRFVAQSNLPELDQSQLIYTPSDTAPGGYTVRQAPYASGTFPFGTTGVVPLSDDNYATLSIPNGQNIPFFGVPYSTVNICSNGFLTFARGASSTGNGSEFDPSPNETDHYQGRPRISALFTDLVPASNVTAGWGDSVGLIVTYDTVTVKGNQTASFQIHVARTGVITVTYLAVNSSTTAGTAIGLASGGLHDAGSGTIINVNEIVNDITDPTVTITSPAPGNVSGASVNFSADFADANTSSGLKEMRFFIDGRQVGNPTVFDPGGVTLDTTGLTNGEKRLEVLAYDESGRQARAAVVVNVTNAGQPNLGFSISGSSRSGPFVTFTLNVTNNGPSTASNVTLRDLWLEGTGVGFVGVRKIYCNPTAGAPLPRNLGSLGSGASTSLELVGYVPSEVTSIRRWVNHGTVTVGGVTSTF